MNGPRGVPEAVQNETKCIAIFGMVKVLLHVHPAKRIVAGVYLPAHRIGTTMLEGGILLFRWFWPASSRSCGRPFSPPTPSVSRPCEAFDFCASSSSQGETSPFCRLTLVAFTFYLPVPPTPLPPCLLAQSARGRSRGTFDLKGILGILARRTNALKPSIVASNCQ